MRYRTYREPSETTADSVVLSVLIYEFSDRADSERKIRRRLRYHKLGPYDQQRVDLLRRLREETLDEIMRLSASRYYTGSHGEYAAVEDFDFERMAGDLARAYPDVPEPEIRAFVPYAIVTYYVR